MSLKLLIRQAHTLACFTIGRGYRSWLVAIENNKGVKGSIEPNKKSGYNCKSIVEAGKQ